MEYAKQILQKELKAHEKELDTIPFLTSGHANARSREKKIISELSAALNLLNTSSPVYSSLPISEILGFDNPFALNDVLSKLAEAAEYLLHKKSYDGYDYEEIGICAGRARDIVKLFHTINSDKVPLKGNEQIVKYSLNFVRSKIHWTVSKAWKEDKTAWEVMDEAGYPPVKHGAPYDDREDDKYYYFSSYREDIGIV